MQEVQAAQRLKTLQVWFGNPLEQLADIEGFCVAWTNTNACKYHFKMSAPLQIKQPGKLKRVDCSHIPDISNAAADLGMDQELAARPRDHECWFFDEGGHSLIVLHDKVSTRYGFQDID